MCTVTYLPTSRGFLLTHNRDETPTRAAQSIVREKSRKGDTLLFPRDAKAGGTWIVTSSNGVSACLLNGAFIKHVHQPPYRRSRGLVLLDLFDAESPEIFFQTYDLEGIEPFTLLFFKHSQRAVPFVHHVVELRWDGQVRHLQNLASDQTHFWCSATLYPPEMQRRREDVFRDWLRYHQPFNRSTAQQITRLHLNGSVGDPENNFVMNRAGKVQTVSVTQVILGEKNARMRYRDLLGEKQSERRLTLSDRRHSGVNR